jgi:hypothetical protein
VRFARLIDRRVGAFGRPSAGAAFGGDLSLWWLHARWRLCVPCVWPDPGWLIQVE